jgi:DNA-binding NtrC family response regulator
MRHELDSEALATAMLRIQARKNARPTIFVVHDDAGFRAALCEELRACGCDVIEPADGASALDQLAMAADGVCAWPDVLVLARLGILIELQGLPGRSPTVVVTERVDTAVAARLGAYRAFQSPIDLAEVVRTISAAAAERQTQTLARRCTSFSNPEEAMS